MHPCEFQVLLCGQAQATQLQLKNFEKTERGAEKEAFIAQRRGLSVGQFPPHPTCSWYLMLQLVEPTVGHAGVIIFPTSSAQPAQIHSFIHSLNSPPWTAKHAERKSCRSSY